MLLTPATPPPHVAPTPVSYAHGGAHGHGNGHAAGSGAYPNIIVTSDMLATHKTKLARKPTPAPAPSGQDVFSTTTSH
jgi:hypothetical protein